MNITVITDSTSYELRAERVADFFRGEGHIVNFIGSDFNHREKTKGRETKSGYLYLDMIPYYKNISFKRLYAHYDFAKKALKELESQKPDLVYVLIPSNSLAKCANIYKRNHPAVRIVIDIIDLWPESLPLSFLKNTWPTNSWKNLRDSNIGAADLIITECELYAQILKEPLNQKLVKTLYWNKDELKGVYRTSNEYVEKNRGELPDSQNKIQICYLGSVNNIIDIAFITNLLTEINKIRKVVLHIIGSGEKITEFADFLKKSEIDIKYYGPVFDEKEKNKIMMQCSYGLNIMKPEVCVGLTMKSVDYLCAGLLLINNIPGDTWNMLQLHGIGFNCTTDSLKDVAKLIALKKVGGEERKKARKIYETYFSPIAFQCKLGECMEEILK